MRLRYCLTEQNPICTEVRLRRVPDIVPPEVMAKVPGGRSAAKGCSRSQVEQGSMAEKMQINPGSKPLPSGSGLPTGGCDEQDICYQSLATGCTVLALGPLPEKPSCPFDPRSPLWLGNP